VGVRCKRLPGQSAAPFSGGQSSRPRARLK
jgi:hypothetical protein